MNADDPACWQAHPGKTCTRTARTAPGGYCAPGPGRCYCGACPNWTPHSTTSAGETVLDQRARKSGKRASGAQRERAR